MNEYFLIKTNYKTEIRLTNGIYHINWEILTDGPVYLKQMV